MPVKSRPTRISDSNQDRGALGNPTIRSRVVEQGTCEGNAGDEMHCNPQHQVGGATPADGSNGSSMMGAKKQQSKSTKRPPMAPPK